MGLDGLSDEWTFTDRDPRLRQLANPGNVSHGVHDEAVVRCSRGNLQKDLSRCLLGSELAWQPWTDRADGCVPRSFAAGPLGRGRLG